MKKSLLLLPIFLLMSFPGHAGSILVLGDSISAGYGLESGSGWVDLLKKRLEENRVACRVTNASISGDTTMGGMARLPRELEHSKPSLLIIELGANDGLRGLPPTLTRKNLETMIRSARAQNVEVLLLGMKIPPNYGQQYTEMFQKVFLDVAQSTGVPLVPFLLEGVGTRPELMQNDGLHPNERAQPRLLANVWQQLAPMLPVSRQ